MLPRLSSWWISQGCKMKTFCSSGIGNVSNSSAACAIKRPASVVSAWSLDCLSSLLRLLDFRDPGPFSHSLKSDFRFWVFESLDTFIDVLSMPMSTLSRTSLLRGASVLLLSRSLFPSSETLSKILTGDANSGGVGLSSSRVMKTDGEILWAWLEVGRRFVAANGFVLLGISLEGWSWRVNWNAFCRCEAVVREE